MHPPETPLPRSKQNTTTRCLISHLSRVVRARSLSKFYIFFKGRTSKVKRSMVFKFANCSHPKDEDKLCSHRTCWRMLFIKWSTRHCFGFLFYVAPRPLHSPPAVLLLHMYINSSLPTSCRSGVAIHLYSFSNLVYLCIYLCFYPSIYLSLCLSVCLPIYLAIFLSFYLSIHLSIYLSIHLSVYLPTHPLYLSIYLI
jgi:hypothetical protein